MSEIAQIVPSAKLLYAARTRRRNGGKPKANPIAVEKAIKLYDTKEYTIR